jgi:phage terminase small subunit
MARTTIQQRRKDNTKSADIASARTAVNTSTMGAAALVPADKPLTDRQRQFVKFWAEGDTIPNAMQRAGYNEQPSYGYRMAKMPNILVEFDRIKAKWEEAAQTSRQQVMEMHKEAFEMAKMMAEPATMVSAAREIGRMCGYYEPVKQRIEFTVNGQIAVKRLEAMSDEDLIRLVTEGLQAGQAAALGQDAQEALEMAQDDEITDV